MSIRIKRAYDAPARNDGFRVLVDRMWPRGITKDKLKLDEWGKEIAPSASLRKWFGHDPAKWETFRDRYSRELDSRSEDVARLRQKAKEGDLTLVFGARDEEHNNAVALKEYLEQGQR
ncbi:MAG: DUF488 domain-containing protein [Solirubrobacterales bacterium]